MFVIITVENCGFYEFKPKINCAEISSISEFTTFKCFVVTRNVQYFSNKLYVFNLVLNFQRFFQKVKVLFEQKRQKNNKFWIFS